MKALVYHGPGKIALEEKQKPSVKETTDALVKVTHTTICGTDLHIMKGDVTNRHRRPDFRARGRWSC